MFLGGECNSQRGRKKDASPGGGHASLGAKWQRRKSERGGKVAQRDSTLKLFVLFQPFSCQFLQFQIPPSPYYLLFQPRTHCVAVSNANISYTGGTPQAGTEGLAWLDKPTSFAKLQWPVRWSEAMLQSTMIVAGARFQPGHAGNTLCLAPSDSKAARKSWTQKLLHFLFCHWGFPPSFAVFLIIFITQAHWRATE